jgi:protein SCO1/2
MRTVGLGISREKLLIGIATALILVGGAACASDQPTDSSPTAETSTQPEHTTLPALGMAPNFELTNQDGVKMELSDLRGSVVLMNFIYTSCPDVCQLQNLDLKRVRNFLDETSRSELVLVSVTFDPEFDTPPVLKNYARTLGSEIPEWYFLTGSLEEIAGVTEDYGVYYVLVPEETHTHDDGTVETHARGFNHINQAYLIDRHGMIRRQYVGTQNGGQIFPIDGMVSDISALPQPSVAVSGERD